MKKLLETLKIVNGQPQFLNFHHERLNYSRKLLFNATDTIELAHFIQAPTPTAIYKCRIIYATAIEHVEYSLYSARHFKSFQVIEADQLAYPFKYLNREAFHSLLQLKGCADDILIIQKGLVTDTSIANVAFWSNGTWLTPATPLLRGTTRARLLQANQILATHIRVTDLKHYSQMALMNALLGFYPIEEVNLIF